MKIILASQSQNRRQLLELADIPFIILPSKIDEQAIRRSDPYKQVVEIARAKAKSVKTNIKNAAIIAADSSLLYRKQVMEKPKFKMEAVDMLSTLSGRSGTFITGWIVLNTLTGKNTTGVEETRITFRQLNKQEIINYVNDHPVTDWAAGFSPFNTRAISFIHKIEGSFTNFTHGLPLDKIIPVLQDFDLL